MTIECNLQDRTIPSWAPTQTMDISQWTGPLPTKCSRGTMVIAISIHSRVAVNLPRLKDGVGIKGSLIDGRSYNDLGNTRDMEHSRNGGFRPLALPQMAYGDGQPFLRGYSNEFVKYGISPEEFIQVLDAINVAVIPSPENQIFQKGANIAGWFL